MSDARDTDDFIVQCHDGQGLRDHKDELLAVYQVVYGERLSDPFFYPTRFWERIEGTSLREGMRLVTGRVQGQLVGFTLGSPLAANTGWWRHFKGDVDPDMLTETGSRTFGINELQVLPEWRRRGFAKALSDALLADLPQERATLLVRTENTPAVTAYRTWGFRTIGHMQPFSDSPVYEAMVKDLGVS